MSSLKIIQLLNILVKSIPECQTPRFSLTSLRALLTPHPAPANSYDRTRQSLKDGND